jgi:hypothetical protein|tara:strand:- start:44 stop:310 length:267 start_codon:yes stop_codon:yes gene_type:complete
MSLAGVGAVVVASGQVRPDLFEGCPEQLGSQIISFLKWVWDRRNKARIQVVEALEAHQSAQVVHHLKSTRDVKLFQDRFVQRDLSDKL